jgi:hypothetical protein
MAEKNYDEILSKRCTEAAKLAFHRTPFASSVRELASEQLDEERLERRRRGYSTGGRRRRSTQSNFPQLVSADPALQYPDSPNSQQLFSASTAIMSHNGSLPSPTVLGPESVKSVDEIEIPAPSKADSKASAQE